MKKLIGIFVSQACVWIAAVQPALSEDDHRRYSYNNFGVPGLLDLPNALSAEPDEMSASFSIFSGGGRSSLTYQATSRLSLTFRYSKIEKIDTGQTDLFDRSFDLRYRLLDEGKIRPAVAIGINDIIGTGVYSSEYIVATKNISPRFNATVGLGWGRLAGRGAFNNPLSTLFGYGATRNTRNVGKGGAASLESLFTGNAAIFGGVDFAISQNLNLKVEYSPDLYVRETSPQAALFTSDTPFNFGISFTPSNNTAIQAYYMHGNAIGFAVNYIFNPKKSNLAGGSGAAPLPVLPRQSENSPREAWAHIVDSRSSPFDQLEKALEVDGISLKSFVLNGSNATAKIENRKFNSEAQALGRTFRAISHVVPETVSIFSIVNIKNGMPVSRVSITRADLERSEFSGGGEADFFEKFSFEDAHEQGLVPSDLTRKFDWSVTPYVQGSYFDPENPVRLDLGVRFSAGYEFLPGLVLSGTAQRRLVGNRGQSTRSDPSTLPRVRTDANIYAKAGFTIPELSLSYNFRPGPDLYSRVSVGYLESMFGGIYAETIWKPINSDFSFGLGVGRVRQRDFDQMFGFQDYDVTTGHATVYKEFPNGYSTSLDIGRYLAGDWGGTFSFSKRYTNGWEVGAYATLTNVSFDDFGEGSFDKGIKITLPIEQIIGKPTSSKRTILLQPILRDGGAKIQAGSSLYADIRRYHESDLKHRWGKFWR